MDNWAKNQADIWMKKKKDGNKNVASFLEKEKRCQQKKPRQFKREIKMI